MGRWDHDDPRDEHDLNELRNYVHKGSKPQFVGKGKQQKGGCLVLAVAVVAPVVAVVLALRGWA
jgi:hypothetical protein